MFGIGPIELVVVFIVALLVFGPSKLPELARTIGRGLAEFRRASSDLRHSMDFDINPQSGSQDNSVPAQASSPHTPPEPGSALDQTERRNVADPETDASSEHPPEEFEPNAPSAAPSDDAPAPPKGTIQADSSKGDETEEPKGG